MRSRNSLGAILVGIFIVFAGTAPSAFATPSADSCTFLTSAQVSDALGVPMAAGSHITPTSLKTCTWSPSGGGTKEVGAITFTLQTADEYEAGKRTLQQMITLMKAENKQDAPVITPVSGVGDEAFYLDMAKTMSLIVKKGNGAFKIVIYGGMPTPKRQSAEKTLALQVLSKM